jgi:hypothetical protein
MLTAAQRLDFGDGDKTPLHYHHRHHFQTMVIGLVVIARVTQLTRPL